MSHWVCDPATRKPYSERRALDVARVLIVAFVTVRFALMEMSGVAAATAAMKFSVPKRIRLKGYAGSVNQSPSISNITGRVLSALVLIWLAQFGIALWFMIGQGYDRETANMVPLVGMIMLPVWAWLVRVGLPDMTGGRALRTGRALLHAAALYLAGLILPAQVVLHVFSLMSPFDELWWVLGSATVILAGGLTWAKGFSRHSRAGSRGTLIGLLVVLGSGASVPLWRAFVLSFFG